MLLFVKLLAPALVGTAVAGGAMFGLVASQTQAPEKNPASEQIITYGE